MKTEHMKCFLEVAKCASVNKAAENLFVSQQNLSIILRNIEKELNCKLFSRTHAGVNLTNEGARVAKYFKNILDEMKALEASLQPDNTAISTMQRIYLNISVSGNVPCAFVADLLLNSSYNEQLCFSLNVLEIDELQQRILAEQDDFYILNLVDELKDTVEKLDKNQWHLKVITTSGIFAIMKGEHPLAKQKTITMKSILKYPVAVSSIGRFDENKTSADRILKQYPEVEIAYYTNDDHVMRRILSNTLAVSFDFRYHRQAFYDGEFVRIPVLDYKETDVVMLCSQELYRKYQELLKQVETGLTDKLSSREHFNRFQK